MSDQSFCLTVPNANCTVSAGAGAVDGFTMTTDANAFHHAGINSIIEAGADARVVAGKVFGAVAGTGVLIGTPCTIQASAGGGVQIYAGAGISPSLGGPSGPGDAFGPSEPADFDAGTRADVLNRINDGIKGVTDVMGAKADWNDASGFDKFKAGYEMAKGGWDTAKAAGGDLLLGEDVTKGVDTAFKLGDMGIAGVSMPLSEDLAGFMTNAAKNVSGMMGMVPAKSGEGLGNTTAATGPTCADGAAGGVLGAPGDGPRIHEVAPANIDRKCGANMTALVGGNKEAKVDGKIEYTSGASISMKAFSKVETQSLFFEAHANVVATMKGLAQAKVESMGKVVVDGKASFKVTTVGAGTIDAKGKLDVKTAGKLTMKAGGVAVIKAGGPMALNAASVGITAKGRISAKAANIELKGDTKVTKKLEVMGTTKLKKPVLICSHTKIQKTLKVGDSCKLG